MKIQNKSVLTRRFNMFKKDLLNYFDGPLEINETVAIRWGMDQCIVAHDGSLGFSVAFYNEDSDQWDLVEIIKAGHMNVSGLPGIHLREADTYLIVDAIQCALKDGFKKIYVHSVMTNKRSLK